MRQSQLFTKTRREAPREEVANNAKLLIRGGFISKELAGVYSFLPLGLRVLEKVKNIIREEMDGVGGQEIQMTTLQNPELYEKTDRWDDEKVDNWFKTELKSGGKLGLGLTHEEAVTAMLVGQVSSYKDLPIAVYQIQKKFRNEVRAKSGIMRGREFTMKDLYSFHTNEEDLNDYYDKVKGAYERVFERVGLGDVTYFTFASGGIFSKYSHEFQTLSEVGEDTIYVCEDKKFAINKEVLDEDILKEFGLSMADLVEKRAIEVGNIFKLGTKYTEPLGLKFIDENGEAKPAIGASYGIGVDRLMGTIAEVYADDKGLVWPKSIAPFALHIVALGAEGGEAHAQAEDLYRVCQELGIEVLLDDRKVGAGEKFADADLIGIPYRVVVSDKTVADGQFELKERQSGELRLLGLEELLEIVK